MIHPQTVIDYTQLLSEKLRQLKAGQIVEVEIDTKSKVVTVITDIYNSIERGCVNSIVIYSEYSHISAGDTMLLTAWHAPYLVVL